MAKKNKEALPLHRDNRHLIKRVLGYFWEYKASVILASVSMVVVALCTAGTAYLVKPAMDDIFIRKDREALMFIPLAFVLLIFVKGLFRFLQNYLMNYCGLKVLEHLRNDLYAKMVRLPMRFFEKSQVGMLMSRILNDVMAIRSSLPSFVMLVREGFTIIGLIGVVFYQDAYLAFWALLVMPLAIYPFFYFGRKLRKLGRKNQVQVADMSSFLQETISGIRVVKAFANEDGEKRRFWDENSRLVSILIKQIIHSELSSRFMELVGAFAAGLVIWYGGLQVIEGHSTPGTFFSFMTALIMLYDPIKKLNSSNLAIQAALAGAERVFEILDSPEIETERGGDEVFAPPFRSLELKDVTFAYPGSEHPALDEVSISVRAGQKVAVVGPSGAGKTTLVNLVPLFYHHSRGEILLNGRPLADYTLDSLRLSLGMVSQDTFLFGGTIKENIAYARPDTPMEEIERAAGAAFADDFIRRLPKGYDTLIGERGVMLSGGQRQRLTIARALLKNPPLLILDEATSALDTESERIVQMALENLMRDRTSIVIAHRLSTILSADVIVVMERGKVVARGRHAQLLKTCPLYERLYTMQFQDEAGAAS